MRGLLHCGQRRPSAVEEGGDQRRMAFERGGHADLDDRMRLLGVRNEPRQVSFQVEAEGEEIGEDNDLGDAAIGESGDGAGQVGLAEFEESRLDVAEGAHFCEVTGDGANAFVGGFDTRAVGENNQAGGHQQIPPLVYRQRTAGRLADLSILGYSLDMEMKAAAPAVERRMAERLAALRGERGWSLDALAERTGMSRATLSRIERGELSPTATMLGKLCSAYGWTLSRLIAEAESQPMGVVRASEQVEWRDPESGYSRRVISPPGAGLRGELVEVRLPARATVAFEASAIAGLEHHLWMLEGALALTVEGKAFRLETGDCVRYVLTGPTRFECLGKRAARYAIAMVHG